MLVLTRKIGERIRIGDQISVRVLEVRGSQVRLGVEAPSDVRILREEIYHPESEAAGVDGTEPEAATAPDLNGKLPPRRTVLGRQS